MIGPDYVPRLRRLGTTCSFPIVSPMARSGTIGGGAPYGAETSPLLARTSGRTASIPSRAGVISVALSGKVVRREDTRTSAFVTDHSGRRYNLNDC